MRGYKGFGPGMVCSGKKYAENMIFSEPEAVICEKGMHFCENPLDVLDYYTLIGKDGELNEFAEVEALDEAKTDDGNKFCTTKIKIGAKLSLKNFVECAVDFALEKTKADNTNSASGDSAKLAASSNSAKLAASGNSAKLAASGNSAKLAASGNDSIVAGIGIDNTAKAKLGCWIVLAEWVYDDNKERYVPVCVKCGKVDGETIKADTWYKLADGEFVEAADGQS